MNAFEWQPQLSLNMRNVWISASQNFPLCSTLLVLHIKIYQTEYVRQVGDVAKDTWKITKCYC